MKIHYLIYLFLTSTFLLSQIKKSSTLPIDLPVQLSGTFGELRKNHFHAGLDIRTRGREGLPVRSIKSGWIFERRSIDFPLERLNKVLQGIPETFDGTVR